MDFDCTKPLGDQLDLYLKNDIDMICYELCINGIVYESQFKSLWSMVCKKNSYEMTKLFSRESGIDISYAYDNVTCNFVYYDTHRFSMREAMEKSVLYQKSFFN